jgi:hypothetical protein
MEVIGEIATGKGHIASACATVECVADYDDTTKTYLTVSPRYISQRLFVFIQHRQAQGWFRMGRRVPPRPQTRPGPKMAKVVLIGLPILVWCRARPTLIGPQDRFVSQ